MKACWVDHGQEYDPDLLRRHEITAPYFDPRDPRVTKEMLQSVRDHGFQPGLYFAWNWMIGSGSRFAEYVDQHLRRIGWLGNPPVCLDIELHDPAWINECLLRWRALRPTRQTDLTIEGMQGGWFGQCAAHVVQCNVRVAPQLFVGAMEPHPHSPIIDLLMAGIPGDRLLGFYDAARLPYRWNGYCLSQGRLPA